MTTRAMIVDLFARYRFPLSDEKALQAAMAEVLASYRVPHVREVRLDDEGKDIVDFMAGEGADLQPLAPCCAIEVKIGGSRRAIFRQVERYCAHPQVAEIVLATSVVMNLPREVLGKPTAIIHLGRSWL
jgi:hypothetical protein